MGLPFVGAYRDNPPEQLQNCGGTVVNLEVYNLNQ